MNSAYSSGVTEWNSHSSPDLGHEQRMVAHELALECDESPALAPVVDGELRHLCVGHHRATSFRLFDCVVPGRHAATYGADAGRTSARWPFCARGGVAPHPAAQPPSCNPMSGGAV